MLIHPYRAGMVLLAGASEDRQKKTTRAVAELLDAAGVSSAVLGDGESCSGDPVRRSGNEFLSSQLAMQNVEVLDGSGATEIVATCAHRFDALENEYPQLDGRYEVRSRTTTPAASAVTTASTTRRASSSARCPGSH